MRDLIRYFRQRSQLYGSIVRPILWLFILGMGLRPSFKTVGGFNYTQFIFPGIIAITLIFTAIQSAISIIKLSVTWYEILTLLIIFVIFSLT